jgi:hypothetical protein
VRVSVNTIPSRKRYTHERSMTLKSKLPISAPTAC